MINKGTRQKRFVTYIFRVVRSDTQDLIEWHLASTIKLSMTDSENGRNSLGNPDLDGPGGAGAGPRCVRVPVHGASFIFEEPILYNN
jgi:hypothetical protein